MTRRELMTWPVLIGAVAALIKTLSDEAQDQVVLWSNMGWSAEEITVLQEKMATIEKRLAALEAP